MERAGDVCFRTFRLDAANERLWCGARKVTLRPKTFAVLRYLVEHAGRLVTKDELLDAVWPDTAVSDVVPIVCVRELRQALGDHPESPRFIETVPRRGYRFIAPLTAAPRPSPEYKVHSLESKKHGTGSFVQTRDAKRQTLDVPLVGRETEFARLHQLLSRALNGERQIVFVSGEPGIGKTALVDTFLRSLVSGVQNPEESQNAKVKTQNAKVAETQPSALSPQPVLSPNPKSQTPNPDLWIAHGQCIEHRGVGEAYLPLLDVTGRLCREPGGERLIAVLRQYAPTWLMQFPSLINAADFDDLQKKTLGATRERMLREMAEVVGVLTTIRPLVLVLEDLHWCDTATLDCLAFLAQRREPARLLLIGTYRPAEVATGGHLLATLKQDLSLHRQCEDIALPLLTQDHVTTYLNTRLPAAVKDEISLHTWAIPLHRRTDGNPLFLVNVVDYLMAHGTGEGMSWSLQSMEQLLRVVPESLQQMIEKQIERLSTQDQQMLEVASIVGIEFSAAAVAAAVERDVVEVEERCRELARHEQFLRTCGVEEWPDETVATRYSFIHSLYQQVLAQRVTGARGARLHLCIGNRLEQGYGHASKEHAAMLAMHFTHGRDYRRAVHYLHQAAENAVWRCAFDEADAHFAKGVELLQHWPDTPERTQQELQLYLTVIGPLMASKGEASPEVEQSYAQIIKLHQRLGATETPFLVLLGLWMVRLVRGELAAAEEVAEQMMKQAEREGEPLVRLWAHLVVGICAFYRGDFPLAHAHFEQEAALYETQQHPQYLLDPKMLGLSLDSLTLWILGYPELALKRSQEAVTWAHKLAHPYNEVAALILAVWLSVDRREGKTAEEQIDVMLPMAHAHGFVQYVAIGTFFYGCAYVEQGRTDEGVGLMSEGIKALRVTKCGVGMSAWQGFLASALGDLGRTDEALAVMTEAETTMKNSGEQFFAAELYRIKGELLLDAERRMQNEEQRIKEEGQDSALIHHSSFIIHRSEEAEACFLKAIDIARQQQAKLIELRAMMSLVRLRQQQVAQHLPCSTQYDTRTLLDEAHQMLSKVYGYFTEGFETMDLRAVRNLLEELQGTRKYERG